jgi:hypothetical protein
MKKVILIGAMIFALGGCAGTGGSSMGGEANADSAKAAIAAADASLKKAATVDGVWRDAGKILKKAKAAAGKKDYATAIKLANKVKFQGDMGYKQAVAQKDVKPWEY